MYCGLVSQADTPLGRLWDTRNISGSGDGQEDENLAAIPFGNCHVEQSRSWNDPLIEKPTGKLSAGSFVG
jgi:hypothetical protein